MHMTVNTRWHRHDWFGFVVVAVVIGAAMLLGYWSA
jgi:hypothetical protein